jgi:hypothetical protein
MAEKEIFGALSVRTVEGREPAPEERDGEDVPKLIEFVKNWNIDCGTGFGTVGCAERRCFRRGEGSVPKTGVFGTDRAASKVGPLEASR